MVIHSRFVCVNMVLPAPGVCADSVCVCVRILSYLGDPFRFMCDHCSFRSEYVQIVYVCVCEAFCPTLDIPSRLVCVIMVHPSQSVCR